MAIKDTLISLLQGKDAKAELQKEEQRRRIRRAVIELTQRTDALTRKDLGDWRSAWQAAINVDNPNRTRLYDIYRDVDVDLHLSGCIGQRQGFVMARTFKLVNESGEEQSDLMAYFDRQWFKDLLRYTMDSIFWGHSLVQLGEVTEDIDGRPTYKDVTLVPRKHVIPEKGRIVRHVGDDWHSGIEYHQEPWSSWLIEIGRPDDLGLFLKAATQTIPKKNNLSFWDSFAEIFGMPMRVVRTDTRDEEERGKLEQMLREAGASQTAILPTDSEFQIIENARGDAYNVYDRRIDRANSELSKLVIGQTMTIEDGSSLSQSQTHLKVFQNIVESDCDMIRDMVNNQLLPHMVRHGFPMKGIRFEWNEAVDYTPEQQKAFEEMVLNNYEVDGKYFEGKYGIPVGERRQGLTLSRHTETGFFD